ncbi:HNH endonuclease [Nocardia africana]
MFTPERTNRPVYCTRKCRTAAEYDRLAEQKRAYTRSWNQLNKHTAAYKATAAVKLGKRRARKLATTSRITTAQWKRVLRRANQTCFYCSARSDQLTMDHVVPLSRGGTHSEGNIVAACGACNYSKGGKLYIEWRVRKGNLQRCA